MAIERPDGTWAVEYRQRSESIGFIEKRPHEDRVRADIDARVRERPAYADELAVRCTGGNRVKGLDRHRWRAGGQIHRVRRGKVEVDGKAHRIGAGKGLLDGELIRRIESHDQAYLAHRGARGINDLGGDRRAVDLHGDLRVRVIHGDGGRGIRADFDPGAGPQLGQIDELGEID